MRSGRSHIVTVFLTLAGATALTAFSPGCSSYSGGRGFESDTPVGQLQAVQQAGDTRDHTKIPALVDRLNSDDPAVRMMSINALDRITGTRLGYNPYASPEHRTAAVERWTEAVRKGQFNTARASAVE